MSVNPEWIRLKAYIAPTDALILEAPERHFSFDSPVSDLSSVKLPPGNILLVGMSWFDPVHRYQIFGRIRSIVG